MLTIAKYFCVKVLETKFSTVVFTKMFLCLRVLDI